MCLLNGEVGGSIESSVDFGTIETVNALGYTVIDKIPIPDIIRNMIHHYAGEPYYNIIINDLDIYGLELLEYRYDDPLYLYRDADSDIPYFDNVLINGDKECSVEGKPHIEKLKDLGPDELDLLVDPLSGSSDPADVIMEDMRFKVAKIEFGQTAGYRETDLVYPGDLIANIGESVTSVLDKIKNMLNDFEYFYNLEGQFVFQRKQAFINTMWSPINSMDNPIQNDLPGTKYQQYVDSLATASSYSYVFSGAELITSFNNNPNLLNMRNDYTVWGTREAIGRQDPIHMRYAIDIKPTYYKAYDGRIYMTDLKAFEELKQQAKQDTLENVYNRINTFNLSYSIPDGLSKPQKNSDGSWSAGWWDIRDWYAYYNALTLTVPEYTMKWYSRNDLEGCVRAFSLDVEYSSTYLTESSYVWLLIYNSNSGKFDASHGNGNPNNGGADKTLYRTYYLNGTSGEYKTEKVLDENGNEIKKYFIQPYSGCSDPHTYIKFLEEDIKKKDSNGNYPYSVFFYNPNFPNYDSFDDLVNDQIDKEYQEFLDSGILNFVDWREIIYQMALDYFKYGTNDDFEIQVRNNNLDHYPTGRTGYEQYYTDIQGYWRSLYNPDLQTKIKDLKAKKEAEYDSVISVLTQEAYTDAEVRAYVNAKTQPENLPKNLPLVEDMIRVQNDKLVELEAGNISNYQQINDNQVYLTLLQGYLTTLTSELRKNEEFSLSLQQQIDACENDLLEYYPVDYEIEERRYWNKSVYECPEMLYFWFDFIDDSELTGFNVKTVGSRPKVINDTAVKSIYFRETPNIIFITSEDDIGLNSAFKYIQVGDIESMFSVSTQAKSAKNRIDELLYNHGYCIESVTINAIPVYYLQPNTRIHLFDEKSGLNGDYIISKITLPLSYNGTMQITATKAAENII